MVERSCLENRRGASLRGFESHPLRQAVLLVLTVVVAACGPIMVQGNRQEPRYFHAVVPNVAEPVQVVDLTGRVVAVELDVGDQPPIPVDQPFIIANAGRPTALLVGWPGGCYKRVDIAVDPPAEAGRKPTVTLKLLPAGDQCAALVSRRVIVGFNGPVDPTAFNFDVVR